MHETIIYLALAIQSIVSSPENFLNPLGRPFGIIVVGIIEFPVVILFLAALLGKPRSAKITSLFMGWMLLMFGLFIGAVFILSYMLSIFY